MNVYIIMGNDFPAGVVDSEELADEIVAKLRAQSKAETEGTRLPSINWRHYDFKLNAIAGRVSSGTEV